MELEITIVSAKHLKNVNWRNGDLKPYAVAYIDDDRRVATKPDDLGSTGPVWNDKLTLPIPIDCFDPINDQNKNSASSSSPRHLTIEIFHSKPSETPKPLVGSARLPLKDILIPLLHRRNHHHHHNSQEQEEHVDVEDDDDDVASTTTTTSSATVCSPILKTVGLHRPSGRPQGKVRIKLSIPTPPPPPPPPAKSHAAPIPSPPPPSSPPQQLHSSISYYYQNTVDNAVAPIVAPPNHASYAAAPYYQPPPPSRYPYAGNYSGSHSSPAAAAYYSAPPPPPAYDRRSGFGGGSYAGGPSAPYDYSSGSSSYGYDQRHKGGGGGGAMVFGHGSAAGSLAGDVGGLALDEGIHRADDRNAERVESRLPPRDPYGPYRTEYRQ